jgi:multidrug efflux pump subunit AcrA (membrane-fusion protein)
MNQTLIQLPDTSKYQVSTKIAEQLVDRVTPGLPALVTIDAIPGTVIRGQVDKISTMPDNSNRWLNPNLKEYITTIVLDSTLKTMKPGMSAKVEIQVAKLSDAIAVPLQSVFAGSGQSYVFLKTGDGYAKRVVKLGLSSNDMVEVKEGIKEGEVVLLSRPKDAPADDPGTDGSTTRRAHGANGGSAGQRKGGGAGKVGA